MMKNTYYFVRHAHSTYTPDERSRPLSDKGWQSLEKLTFLSDFPITTIYSSPYKRVVETVTPLAQQLQLPIHLEEELRERKLGETPVSDEKFDKTLQALWAKPSFHLKGGESNQTALKRALNVLESMENTHSDEHIVISSHGNLICILLQHFDARINYDFWKNLPMPAIIKLDREQCITRLL